MLEREYLRESLSYVLAIQDVQERIKFEFVETLLSFMSGWLVFYHLGHEIAEDAKQYMTDLQHKVQKVSELDYNYEKSHSKYSSHKLWVCLVFGFCFVHCFLHVRPSGAKNYFILLCERDKWIIIISQFQTDKGELRRDTHESRRAESKIYG